MKNSNKYPYKIPAGFMNLIAIVCVVVSVISERFGTYPSYSSGRFSRMELVGIIIPLMILVVPIFVKSYRESIWNAKNIVLTLIILIISVLLITVMYCNKDFYRILWIEEGHWTRDNCPPIRWDFWNIIGKSA